MPVSSTRQVSMPMTDRHTGALHFDDIVAARHRLRGHLTSTPLVTHPLLAARIGCVPFVKLENAQLLGSFKIRGGLNLLATLTARDADARRAAIMGNRSLMHPSSTV